MADQSTPAERSQAPDPARSYERAKPEAESGMGRLDNNTDATPQRAPDRTPSAVTNQQDPRRQVNAQDVVDDRAKRRPGPQEGADEHRRSAPAARQPDHSMKEEEPDGWDQAPTDIHDPRQQRHPRREGKGGTP
jgi:hypothetical protein